MRLLHCADIHLGCLTHSRTDPETGLPSRLLDMGRCWHRACEIAADREVDAVIVAGDIFHGPNPDAAALMLFREGLRTLEEHAIPTLLVAGNHDRAARRGAPTVLEVFASPLVRVSSVPERVAVGGITVATLPSVSREQLMATRGDLWRSGAEAALVEGLEWILDEFRAGEADVLSGHWPVQGTVLGAERDIAIIPEPMLHMDATEGPWELAAFGHIHHGQSHPLSNESWLIYPGSIDRMNFGEEHQEKRVVEWDLSRTPGAPATFHTLPAREFRTFDFPGEEAATVADGGFPWAFEPDLEGIEGSIVRARLDVPADLEIDVDAIQRSLYQAGAHVAYVQVNRERRVRPRAEQVTEELGAGDALELWFESDGIDESERPALRELAKQLGEEVA